MTFLAVQARLAEQTRAANQTRPRTRRPLAVEASPLVIREETRTDAAAREALLNAALGPTRFDKASERLREGRKPARGLALIATLNGEVVGTVRLWHVEAGGVAALLLGPLAVSAKHRSLGIGAALMHAGLRRATARGHKAVLLVGDAAYYERFGFSRALTRRLAVPGPVGEARFLGREFVSGALAHARGTLTASGEFARPQALPMAA